MQVVSRTSQVVLEDILSMGLWTPTCNASNQSIGHPRLSWDGHLEPGEHTLGHC